MARRLLLIPALVATCAPAALAGDGIATLSDKTFPAVEFLVDSTTLYCSPAPETGDQSVAGMMQLKWPAMNEYTTLSHYPTLETVSLGETCDTLPILLAKAAEHDGIVTADVRIVLTEELRVLGDGSCQRELSETVIAKLPGKDLANQRIVEIDGCGG